MSLAQGYLRNSTIAFSRKWILTGILIGLNFALAIYAFSILFREAFRIYTHFFVGYLLVLTSERLFYDVFYAVISSIIGCSFALKFIFENSRNHVDAKVRLKQSSVINDHNFTTWNTLNWMAKTFVVTGLLFIAFIIQFDIDFYDEFYWLFILLPLGWFSNLWLSMLRLFGRKAYRWIRFATLIIAINSFFLINLNIVDSNLIDKKLLQSSVEYNYDVNTPSTFTYSRLPNFNPIDLYVGFDKKGDRQTVHIIGDYMSQRNFNELYLDEVRDYLFEKMDKLDEMERYRESVRLFIDRNVDMHTVYLLNQEIARAGIYNIFYQTDPKNSHYPPHYPPYFNFGITSRSAYNCDCEVDVIDSLRSLDYKSKQIRFPDTYCYRMAHLRGYNRLKVSLQANDELMLNGTPVTYEKLTQILYKFENKYYRNSLILLDVDGRSSFGNYIEIMDLIRAGIIDKRNTLSLAKYNLPHSGFTEPWGKNKSTIDSVEREVLMNILEMNYSDNYLYNFLKEY